MRSLFLALWLAASCASAAPYLVSDPYVVGSDPNLNPVSFIVHGLAGSDISVPATQTPSGQIALEYDLANLGNGTYHVTAAAVNVFGGQSPFSSPPFDFTKGVPGVPTGLRISNTLLP